MFMIYFLSPLMKYENSENFSIVKDFSIELILMRD